MLAPRPLLLPLLVVGLTLGASLPPGPGSHPGVCPNQLSPNLWVDAQSTCERECVRDQDCQASEKCCANVCGLQSCVAARFPDGSPAVPTPLASCEGFTCAQQGSDCDIWDGQPVCRCRDRCEKEPSFTCASDGLTYYNRCYMDAEACLPRPRLAESRASCEDACPVPRTPPCRACRLRSKLALSLCRSDFAIVGRLTEVLEEPEVGGGGIARVALDEVLKDDKMGLRFLGTKYLEMTLSGMDWTCPCPNVTAGDGPLVIMGEVRDGVAVLDAGSYVRAASEKRVKKISELLEKKACELLNRFQD
ncbi:WAP, Kazal, immunoglobulin, Kunitz and NTR domain-containing protein 1 [Crocuta crocuta]